MVFLARAVLLLCCFWAETSLARRARWRRFQDGKFIIGALFPITRGPGCAIVLEKGLLLAEAFIYKLTAHRNGCLSSGTAIGYDMRDTCSNPAGALMEVLDILRENGGFSRKNCSLTQVGKSCGLVAVVGPDLSSNAMVTSGVLSAYRIPQISYGASSSFLDVKSIYSTFFSTGPSHKQIAASLASVIAHFEWSCINTITSRSSFYLGVAASLKQELKNRNVCVAISEVVANYSEISRLFFKIKEHRGVAVNVILGSEDLVVHTLDEAKKLNLLSTVWIGIDLWGRNLQLVNSYDDVMDGTLWISTPKEDLGEFKSYASWIFWNISGVYCPWLDKTGSWPSFCERDGHSQDSSVDLKGLSWVKIANVMNAVLVITHGLEYVTQCDFLSLRGVNCMADGFNANLVREFLLKYLENNSFINNRNLTVSFNSDGELNARYDIVNMRVARNNTMAHFRVGGWTKQLELGINDSDIRWPGKQREVPYSGCRERCPLGTQVKYSFGVCWWSCEKCPLGAYNNNTSACKGCPKEQMPNQLQSACVNKPLTIINSDELLAVVLLSACGLGEMLTLFVVGVIIRYQDTPVVKATNLTFTMLSLLVLLAWFLIPVLYIGEPSDIVCKMRTVSPALLYTAITSVLLTKTNRLIKIFSAINVKKHPFLGNCWYSFLTSALITVQLGLSVFHLAVFPPKVVFDYSSIDSLIVTCNTNLIFDIAGLGYNTVLSITCCFLAYQSRNLPRAYNEFKWICLAIFTNVLSWLIILINRHVSAAGKTNLISTIIALVLGAYSTLFLLFFPKVRIIFFRPEKNTKQAAIESTRRYSLDQASGIDLSPIHGGPRRNTSPACLTLQFMNGSVGKLPGIKGNLGPRRSQGSIIATIKECPEERKSSV